MLWHGREEIRYKKYWTGAHKKKVVALYGRTTDLYAWPYEFLFEQTSTIICKGRRRTTPQVLGQ